MDLLVILLVMVLLLLLKGFFSGSEMALVNADKFKMHHKANQGHKGAKLVLKLFETPDVLLGTTLVGTNIATIVLTILGTMLMIRAYGQLGDLYAVLVFTPLFLVLGEIVPKSVYQQKSNEIAPVIVYPLRVFSILFYPLVFVFSRIARLCARLVGGGKGEQTVFITREQMRMVVDMAERGANVDVFDRVRIKRVIRFAETSVGEAMIPVSEITAINRNRDTRSAINLVRRRGYNRLPVYSQNISNIVDIVTLTTWDLMDPELPDRPLEELMKPAHYVSPYQTIDQLLPVLRNRDDHMAIVVNEFGSAIGMITMEDILEEVVGEIDVGYDFEEYLPRRKRIFEMLEEEVYLMDARLAISEVNEVLGTSLPAVESHTIGGLMIARLRHIPAEGESIVEAGFRFTVKEATDRAVVKLRVEPA
ncbi:MAG: hemolysin family protein [Gammaproteobacteria bacterium]|nr:hemolysin family protein [Gammaproteobacteria bacterium]